MRVNVRVGDKTFARIRVDHGRFFEGNRRVRAEFEERERSVEIIPESIRKVSYRKLIETAVLRCISTDTTILDLFKGYRLVGGVNITTHEVYLPDPHKIYLLGHHYSLTLQFGNYEYT